MRTFSVIVERDPDTGLLVGSVPGWPGAHSQGATLDELDTNLREVIEMLLQDGDPNWHLSLWDFRPSRSLGMGSLPELIRHARLDLV